MQASCSPGAGSWVQVVASCCHDTRYRPLPPPSHLSRLESSAGSSPPMTPTTTWAAPRACSSRVGRNGGQIDDSASQKARMALFWWAACATQTNPHKVPQTSVKHLAVQAALNAFAARLQSRWRPIPRRRRWACWRPFWRRPQSTGGPAVLTLQSPPHWLLRSCFWSGSRCGSDTVPAPHTTALALCLCRESAALLSNAEAAAGEAALACHCAFK